jgi:comEA protein
MSAPAGDPSSKTSIWRVFEFWDSALLMLMVLTVCGMTGYLLYPQSAAVLKLQSVPVSSALTVAPSEVVEAKDLEAPSHTKKRHQHLAHKKPKQPPILNLNQATLQQLQLLPGIGPKMAERVLEYRKTKGPFQSTEQIMDVKGIGPKKFEKFKAYLKL